jgi:RNA polymerase sigma-70 factor (ECF subfamily)
METRADVFASARPMLFSIAYRMLGSVMDAEDLVQEAYLRWEEAKATEVRSPQAYLTTIVTRLAINQLRAARTKRETYVGPWLPEPLVTEEPPDTVELAESLSMAFLVLLERLGPVERAAFLLHEVFDFEYAEIARVLGKTEANCRQLVARARKRVGSPQARFETDPAQAKRLVEKFTEASLAGDMEGLVALLAEDITLWGDGGGKVAGAALKPVHGASSVARFALGVMERLVPRETVVRPAEINGQPGFVAYVSGRPLSALIFDIRAGRIQTIYAIGNPDKLQSLPDPPRSESS